MYQMPFVQQEPDVQVNALQNQLAWKLGFDNWQVEIAPGMEESTVIVHGEIPPECLMLLD